MHDRGASRSATNNAARDPERNLTRHFNLAAKQDVDEINPPSYRRIRRNMRYRVAVCLRRLHPLF